MKRGRLLQFYLLLSILVVLAITAVFFIRIAATRDVNVLQARERFAEFTEEVAQAWGSLPVDEAGARVSDTLSDTREVSPLVVSIYSFEFGIDYLWARDDRFLPEGSWSPEAAAPNIAVNELVHARFSRSFTTSDGDRRIITAVYPVLTQESAYPALRDTLLAFLVFVAVALVIAILTIVHSRRLEESERGDQDEPVPPAAGQAPLQTPPAATPIVLEMEASPSEEPADEDEDRGERVSAASSLNPEYQFLPRLSRELERAGYHEQDLSVALFAFTSEQSETGDAEPAKVSHAISTFFAFDDLCFVHGEAGAAVIFPNSTLRDAIGQVERFQRYLWNERAAWGDSSLDMRAGISARNGRLVEGPRVLEECQAALRRSVDVAGRIMAFNPDPERYRAYLSG